MGQDFVPLMKSRIWLAGDEVSSCLKLNVLFFTATPDFDMHIGFSVPVTVHGAGEFELLLGGVFDHKVICLIARHGFS